MNTRNTTLPSVRVTLKAVGPSVSNPNAVRVTLKPATEPVNRIVEETEDIDSLISRYNKRICINIYISILLMFIPIGFNLIWLSCIHKIIDNNGMSIDKNTAFILMMTPPIITMIITCMIMASMYIKK